MYTRVHRRPLSPPRLSFLALPNSGHPSHLHTHNSRGKTFVVGRQAEVLFVCVAVVVVVEPKWESFPSDSCYVRTHGV